jgi:rRNA-processing protein FCF1
MAGMKVLGTDELIPHRSGEATARRGRRDGKGKSGYLPGRLLVGERKRNVRIRRKHSLTACDAAYLEIATKEENAVATVDRDLRQAAIAEVVELL